MPIYEFRCRACGSSFEELVRSQDTISGLTCPHCGSREVEKQISAFASPVSTTRSSGATSGGPSCSPGGT